MGEGEGKLGANHFWCAAWLLNEFRSDVEYSLRPGQRTPVAGASDGGVPQMGGKVGAGAVGYAMLDLNVGKSLGGARGTEVG